MRNMEKLRVVIGAGEYNNNLGWIHKQEQDLNVLEEKSWNENFKIETIDVLLAEHVWEHFTYDEGVTAVKLCWKYLKPGGYFRCAVPDGYFPNKQYQKVIQVGGPGPKNHPAASHKTVYNFKTLVKLFSEAGFECELLEYHDKNGVFHQINWNKEDGNIFRSVKVDPRNSSTVTFPSLIIDAKKSLKVKFSSTV